MTTATTPRAGAPTPAAQRAGLGFNIGGAKPFKRKRPRGLTPLIVVILLITAAMALTVLTPDRQGNTEDLDPANPGYNGAQGLARVLNDHGVVVTVVRSQRELLQETLDGATTLVVTRPDHLSKRTAQAAQTHAAAAASVVLLNPEPAVTKALGLPVDSHSTMLEKVPADCRGAEVGKDFQLAQADRAYAPTSGTTAKVCFPDPKARAKAKGSGGGGGGAMISLPGAAGRPPMILLGDDSLVSNGAILRSDNAAIALRLFGQTDRLVWYIPSLADLRAAEGTSGSIAPPWFQPALALATSAVVLLCLWRGRRLGRLVTEPLPVIVRAVETTESRGRMYRKSRDRARALAVLQLATRRRLTAYLGLSPSSSVGSVSAAAAAVSGRPYQEVLDLLSSATVKDDSSLLEHANNLAALEKEARRT